MTIIFDSARRIKPTRKAFALGVARPSRPDRRQPFTSADLTWAAANLNLQTRQYELVGPSDAAIEQAAGCALVQAKLDAGFPLF